jgi:hypothetical protein
MSIKTLRKRIALVAVSALGAGLMSVTPALAAIGDVDENTYDIAANAFDGTASSGICADPDTNDNELWSVVGGTVFVENVTNADDATAANDVVRITVSGNAFISAYASNDATDAVAAGNKVLTSTGTAADDEFVESVSVKLTGVAGDVVTVSVASKAAAATSYTTQEVFTINIVAACTTNTVSVADSYVSAQDAAAQTATSNVDDAGATTVVNGGTGYLSVALNTAYGTDLSTAGALEVSATNGAIVAWNEDPTLQVSSDVESDTGADDVVHIEQGTANAYKPLTTVVTVKFNGTVIGSRTFNFRGDAASITVSGLDVGQVGVANNAAPNTNLGDFVVKDSAGNQLAGYTPGIVSSTYNGSGNIYAVIANGASSATAVQTLAWSCTATASTDEIAIVLENDAGNLIVSSPFVAACGGAAYTYSASFDKAAYNQGEIATLTITAKDIAGFAPFKGETVDSAAGVPSIATPQLTAVQALAAADVFNAAGVKTYTFTVGSTAGKYNASVALGYTGNAAVTVPYTVNGDGGVSNAEVLAAIVKLIASINKQIKALQKSLRR